jgi:hypothetical protein
MDHASRLRTEAAQCFEKAASATTGREADRLNELGGQLELWADDLETETGLTCRNRRSDLQDIDPA